MREPARANKPRHPAVRGIAFALAVVVCAAAATGCLENNSASSFGIGSFQSSALNQSGLTMNISSVSIAAISGGASQYTTNIFFNTSTSQGQFSNLCSASSSTSGTTASNACVCNFAWTQVNTTSGSAVSIAHAVQTPVTSVQPAAATCAAPSVYLTQILTGMTLNVSVQPATGNSNAFTVTPYAYVVGSSGQSGDFQDAAGDTFQNIDRYACYEEFQRGMNITSYIQNSTIASSGQPVNYPMASMFCVTSATGASSGAAGCTTQTALVDYTAQTYYYNLYIRDSALGSINYSNSNYICPQVKQALGNNGTSSTENKAWPLDSSFALSLGQTSNFTVGVAANSLLSNGSDPSSAGSSCNPAPTASSTSSSSSSSSSSTSNSTIVSSCLGYAMAPSLDGICSSFTDSTGKIRQTYRLRRYVVVYPPIFDTSGAQLQSQASDTVYVIDRPVQGPNPLQPYTMAGPKPCPFAYFDHTNVTGGPLDYVGTTANTQYVATSNTVWTGTNVDNIQFPNTDSANSCAAVTGLLSDASGEEIYTLGTVNASNPAMKKLFIRPVTAWAPHYIEDTSFQACAPLASPFKDPPLHFAKSSTGTVGWCAEAYPSQNGNVASLDPGPSPTPLGDVAPFTSHVVKNSGSATCTADVPALSSEYPVAGNQYARHLAGAEPQVDSNNGVAIDSNVTCDRTVEPSTTGSSWAKFPLLAPPADVESAITNDPSGYGCLITYDNGSGKAGKTSPSQGCCGTSVTMTTGTTGNSTAHLEPDVSCLTPQY